MIRSSLLLLGHVRVFMFLVRTDGVKRANAENADDGAENVGLFEVKIDPFCGFVFHEFDCALDVGDG